MVKIYRFVAVAFTLAGFVAGLVVGAHLPPTHEKNLAFLQGLPAFILSCVIVAAGLTVVAMLLPGAIQESRMMARGRASQDAEQGGRRPREADAANQ